MSNTLRPGRVFETFHIGTVPPTLLLHRQRESHVALERDFAVFDGRAIGTTTPFT
jgi:hypothetical protein